MWPRTRTFAGQKAALDEPSVSQPKSAGQTAAPDEPNVSAEKSKFAGQTASRVEPNMSTEAPKLGPNISPMCLNGRYSDVTFLVGEEKIHAHKVVLAAKSKRFDNMFDENSEKKEITISNTSVEAFRLLLDYIYTDTITIPSDSNLFLQELILAHQYSVKQLESAMFGKISTILDVTNACFFLNGAYKEDLDELRDECHSFVDANAMEILSSDSFNSLTRKSLIQILERNTLGVPEIEIFKSVAKWCERNNNVDHEVLQCVRFPLLTVSEIVTIVSPTKLVSSEKMIEIISEIVGPAVKDLRSEAQEGESRIKLVESQLVEIQGKYVETERTLVELQEKSQKLQQEKDAAEHEAREKETRVLSLSRELYDSKFKLEELERMKRQVLSLSRELYDSNVKVEELERLKRQHQAELDELVTKQVTADKNVHELETTKRSLEAQVAELKAQNKKQEDIVKHLGDLEAKLDALTTRIRLKVMGENIATVENGAKVISELDTSNNKLLSGNTDVEKSTKHKIDGKNGITVRLSQPHCINHIRMMLHDANIRYYYSYYIETSLDQKKWHRVVDYGRYSCRSVQYLYFDEQEVHYIKIVGTRSNVGTDFQLVFLEAFYKSKIPKTRNAVIYPETNVATLENGAMVIEGKGPSGSRDSQILLNGKYDLLTYHEIGDSNGIIVQLAQPYVISSMQLLLYTDSDTHHTRKYKYFIEMSINGADWEIVIDRRNEECQRWQDLHFAERVAVFIKITGTYSSYNNLFYCFHFECPSQGKISKMKK